MTRLVLGACLAIASLALAAVPTADRAEAVWCKCYCGEMVRAPCPDIDRQCQELCDPRGGRHPGGDDPPPPPPPPVEVQKTGEAQAALDRGDLDAALEAAKAAAAANRCYAPAFQLLGDLYLRAPARWSCTVEGEAAPCSEVGAFNLRWAGSGCDGAMQGLDAAALAALRARADPLYDAAHQARSRRLARKVLAGGDAKLKAGDAAGAETDDRYVIGLFQGAIQPSKEDADFATAYQQLSAALAAQGRLDEAIAALADWEKTPFARAYGTGGSFLRLQNDERKRDLLLETGCQLVMENGTAQILNLYLSPGSSTEPVCRALGWKDELVAPPPGGPFFCYVHAKPGKTYLLSVKRVFQKDGKEQEERAFWQNSPGGGWFCKAGEVHTWKVREISKGK